MEQHYDAAQRYLRAGDQLKAAAEYKDFLGEAIHRAANAQAQGGDLIAAAQSFDEAMTFSGKDESVVLDYASLLFDRRQFADADKAAQKVVTAEPSNPRAQILLGQILFEEKNYQAACLHLRTAADSGQFVQVWRTLAIAYLRLRQLDRARVVLNKAVTLLGDTPQNSVAVASIFYYGDYADEAAEELKKIIKAHPDTPDAHYFLGLTYLAKDEEAGYAKAIPEFRAELAIAPIDYRSHYMLGYIAVQQRHFEDAELELRRSLAANPGDLGAQLLLGQVYSETGQTQQGEDVLRRLIASWDKSLPGDSRLVRAHYMLGRMLRDSGKTEDGNAEIKSAEQLRKQLRNPASVGTESRLKGPATEEASTIGSVTEKMVAPANSAEQARAQEFVSRISPLIGEAYYNLGGISALHKESMLAAQYLQMATRWDPSLATTKH
jgi:tetratricopeptide (TPR) repeat protein